MLQLPSCVQESEVNRSLTCWPLDAIGVDLNSQNQQKGAGVHRLAVLVHFQCAGERISLRKVRARKVVEPSPSTPPIFAEWSFRHRGRQGRASSANWRQGKQFRKEISFSSPLSFPASTSLNAHSMSWAPPRGRCLQWHSSSPNPRLWLRLVPNLYLYGGRDEFQTFMSQVMVTRVSGSLLLEHLVKYAAVSLQASRGKCKRQKQGSVCDGVNSGPKKSTHSH